MSWRASSELFYGYPCIELVENSEPKGFAAYHEKTLAGIHGEIWEEGPGRFKAAIRTSRVAKHWLPASLHPVMPGDETVVRFGIDELPAWVKRLRVPREFASQLRHASG